MADIFCAWDFHVLSQLACCMCWFLHVHCVHNLFIHKIHKSSSYIYIYTCIYKYTLYMDIHLDKPLTFCCWSFSRQAAEAAKARKNMGGHSRFCFFQSKLDIIEGFQVYEQWKGLGSWWANHPFSESYHIYMCNVHFHRIVSTHHFTNEHHIRHSNYSQTHLHHPSYHPPSTFFHPSYGSLKEKYHESSFHPHSPSWHHHLNDCMPQAPSCEEWVSKNTDDTLTSYIN